MLPHGNILLRILYDEKLYAFLAVVAIFLYLMMITVPFGHLSSSFKGLLFMKYPTIS